MNQKAIDKTAVAAEQAKGGYAFTEAQKACFSVNLEKMTAGIGTIFTGVMQLLTALEHDPDGEVQVLQKADSNGGGLAIGATGQTVGESITGTLEEPEETQGRTGKAAEQERTSKAALTADDISKVVVQKIRQDRSKAAAIGTLLKNYGADHISKLSPEHYEAFMTEIAQL